MSVIDLKKRQAKPRATRDLIAIDQHSGAGRFFAKLVRDIENDLGKRRNLSRIESELIRALLVLRPRCNIRIIKSRWVRAVSLTLPVILNVHQPCCGSARSSAWPAGRVM